MRISWRANFIVFFSAAMLWIGISIGGIVEGVSPAIYLRDCYTSLLLAWITCLAWQLSKIEKLYV